MRRSFATEQFRQSRPAAFNRRARLAFGPERNWPLMRASAARGNAQGSRANKNQEQVNREPECMSDWIPAVWEIVDRPERIVLSERDTARILKLLERPPKPTAPLLAAARRRALAS